MFSPALKMLKFWSNSLSGRLWAFSCRFSSLIPLDVSCLDEITTQILFLPRWTTQNREVVKIRSIYGQADRTHTHNSLPAFLISLWSVCALRLWLHVFWNGCYTRKKSFSSNYKNPQFLLLLLLGGHLLLLSHKMMVFRNISIMHMYEDNCSKK